MKRSKKKVSVMQEESQRDAAVTLCCSVKLEGPGFKCLLRPDANWMILHEAWFPKNFHRVAEEIFFSSAILFVLLQKSGERVEQKCKLCY